MIRILLLLVAALLYINAQAQSYSVQPVPFNKVEINDNFWAPILETHAHTTLQTCIAQTQDSTERINNFKKAAGIMKGKHKGIYFDDSDVYKAIEGIAYSLVNNPNPEYEALLDKWIDLIARSQEPDGYLNTYHTLNDPDKRWTDMTKHEMYCGGHMIEAAIAHHKATGKTTFMDVAVKFADHLINIFGPGKRHWVAGHEEIELALVKLYHETGNEAYLDFAHWVLEERGHGHGEGWIWTEVDDWGPAYCQDDTPVAELTDIKGHAVRAMYLFTGMADVAAEKGLPEYVAALERVWEDVVERNMYVTGGIGSAGSNEGFTVDYDLPNKTAYCESCASIGMVLWNNRMNLLSRDAKYVDVMERSLYNGVLPGLSLDGDLYFYVNPLESDGDHHRKRWYGCACCPGNIARLLPSVGSYIYLSNSAGIYVNLFIGSTTEIKCGGVSVNLTQETDYPWKGDVKIKVDPSSRADFTISVRIPGWCDDYTITVNGKDDDQMELADGYVNIVRLWNPGDQIEMNMEMPLMMVEADPRVKENIGKRAIQRGPLVYCMEQTDHENADLVQIALSNDNSFKTKKGKGKLKGMTLIEGKAYSQKLTFVPYFAWDNREAGKMKVWVDFLEE